jgi:hypothetical protein
MSDPKDLGVRVNLIESKYSILITNKYKIKSIKESSPNLHKYTFDATKLSFELGLYIIKISLCEASNFNSILTNFGEYVQNNLTDITKFVELYHSKIKICSEIIYSNQYNIYIGKKLLEICPHEERYSSIWNHFYK